MLTIYFIKSLIDGIKFTKKQQRQGCKDIAAQLVDDNNFIDVTKLKIEYYYFSQLYSNVN
jgi:hypothetical protein